MLYLIEKPDSDLAGVKLAIATNRIDETPRKYWQNFEPITKLKCGITKGKKLDALKEVFYLTPELEMELLSEVTVHAIDLGGMTLSQLKDMARKQGIVGYSRKRKQELVDLLSKG